MKKLLLTVYNKILLSLSLTTFMANHVFGKHHTIANRRICGVIVMMFGIALYRIIGSIDHIIAHFLADTVG